MGRGEGGGRTTLSCYVYTVNIILLRLMTTISVVNFCSTRARTKKMLTETANFMLREQ